MLEPLECVEELPPVEELGTGGGGMRSVSLGTGAGVDPGVQRSILTGLSGDLGGRAGAGASTVSNLLGLGGKCEGGSSGRGFAPNP